MAEAEYRLSLAARTETDDDPALAATSPRSRTSSG